MAADSMMSLRGSTASLRKSQWSLKGEEASRAASVGHYSPQLGC